MKDTEWVAVALALMSSGILTTLLVNLLSRAQNAANVENTEAETQDILVSASQKAMSIMEKALEESARRMRAIQIELDDALVRIIHLESVINDLNVTVYDLEATIERRKN